MKAVMVGSLEDDRVYYIIDAKGSANDGAIMKPDGNVIMFRFFSWVSRNPDIKKIRNTKFHRSLWDSPINPGKGRWFETFIEKSKEIDKAMLEGVVVKTDLVQSKKGLKKKTDRIRKFVSTKNESIVILSNKTIFKEDDRRRTWVSMKLFWNNEDKNE